jgi:hypothetical protein
MINNNEGMSIFTLRKTGRYAGSGLMRKVASKYLYLIDAPSVQLEALQNGQKPMLICLRIEIQSVTTAKSHTSDHLFDYTIQQGYSDINVRT